MRESETNVYSYDQIQSAPSGQFQCFVKSFHGSSTGRWADSAATVQPGKEKIATGTS